MAEPTCHLSIHALRGIRRHGDALLLEGLETRRLNLDRVGVRDQVRHGVVPRLVGRRGVARTLADVRYCDRRILDRRTLRIGHRSEDAAEYRLPEGQRRSEGKNQNRYCKPYAPLRHFAPYNLVELYARRRRATAKDACVNCFAFALSRVIETARKRGLPKEGTSRVYGICGFVADTHHDVLA